MKNIRSLIKKCQNTAPFAEQYSPFGYLPVELLNKIFENLSFSQRRKLRQVCPRWRSIMDNQMKFNAILNNSTLPWLQKCQYELHSLCMQDLTASLTPLKTQLPLVNEFVIGRGNSAQNVLKFLSYFYDRANSLSLQNLSLSQVTPFSLVKGLPRMQWFCLGTLSITLGTRKALLQIIEQYPQHIDAVIGILKSVQLKTLRNLTIHLDYADESSSLKASCNDFKKPVLEVLSFIIKHQCSLRELNLSLLGKPAPDERILGSELLFELPKLLLDLFSVKFDSINTQLASVLALSVNKVKTLKIRETYWTDGYKGSIDSKFRLGSVLRKHGPTLEMLETRTVVFPFLAFGYLASLITLDIRTCIPNNIGSDLVPPIPTLTKFTTLILNEDIATLDDRLINCIATHLPNVEEVEAFLFGDVYIFKKEHLEAILGMPKIIKLKIGKHFSSEFLDLCDTMGPESGVRYLGEEDKILPDNMDSYHCIVLHFNHRLIPKKYRAGNIGGGRSN